MGQFSAHRLLWVCLNFVFFFCSNTFHKSSHSNCYSSGNNSSTPAQHISQIWTTLDREHVASPVKHIEPSRWGHSIGTRYKLWRYIRWSVPTRPGLLSQKIERRTSRLNCRTEWDSSWHPWRSTAPLWPWASEKRAPNTGKTDFNKLKTLRSIGKSTQKRHTFHRIPRFEDRK